MAQLVRGTQLCPLQVQSFFLLPSPMPSPVHSGHPLTLMASMVWPCSLLCGVNSISQPPTDILGRITSLFGGTCLVHCGIFSSICGLYPLNSICVTSYNQECHTHCQMPPREKKHPSLGTTVTAYSSSSSFLPAKGVSVLVSPMAWSPLEYLVIALSSQPESPKAVLIAVMN